VHDMEYTCCRLQGKHAPPMMTIIPLTGPLVPYAVVCCAVLTCVLSCSSSAVIMTRAYSMRPAAAAAWSTTRKLLGSTLNRACKGGRGGGGDKGEQKQGMSMDFLQGRTLVAAPTLNQKMGS